MAESNIFDVQASEPYDYMSTADNSVRRVVPQHVNLRLHVLAPTMERVVELMHEHHPEAVLHQIIKRTNVRDVIVDPQVWRDER
jgi:hypothetical protein